MTLRRPLARTSGFSQYAERVLPGGILLLVLGLLAAFTPGPQPTATASGVPGAAEGPSSVSAPGPSTPGPAAAGAKGTSPAGGTAVADAGGPGTAGPTGSGVAGTGDGASGAGSAGAGGTGSRGAGTATNGRTYQGVTADAIKLAYMFQTKTCGGANPAAVAAGVGIAAGDTSTDILAAEEYYNKYGFSEFALPASIAAHVGHGKGFWGRKITHILYDDGGFTCPDQARAVATQAATQDKVFGAVKYGTDGVEAAEAEIFGRNKLFFTGIYDTTPQTWKSVGPYTFDGRWGTGLDEMRALGSWTCRDKAGKPANNTGDVRVNGKLRKFGLIYVDLPEGRNAARLLESELARCRVNAELAAYPLDEAQVGSVAATTMAKMAQDGVTTILNLIDFVNIRVFTQAATNSAYFPEWLNSSFLLEDWMQTLHTFWDPSQIKNMEAVSERASVIAPAFEDQPAAKAWAKLNRGVAMSSNWDVWYQQFYVLALGLATAGPDLTPANMVAGLRKYCSPCPRSDPRLPLFSLAGDRHELEADFTVVKWNSTKPDITSPKDSSGNRPTGYWDFPERGKRYLYGDILQPES
jgi:hypothetical protein